jgi:NADPH:quinone reductase-like Zn-dependent oxidoreductase
VRALRCEVHGTPEVLVLADIDEPTPDAGAAVVDIRAAAVNYPDVLIVADRYQVSVPPPFTPGSEFAGVVVEVGDGVTGVRPGDEVMGVSFVGAFAERVAVDATGLAPIPSGMSFAEAAAVQVTYATALSSLRVGGARPGEWVVVLGAVGGVGSATVDVARRLGCRVVACVSNAERAETARGWGADAVVDYGADDLKAAIRNATGGGGGDVVIDPVGGDVAEPALRALRRGGRFVTVGYASGEIPKVPLNLVLLKGITIVGFEMRGYTMHEPDRAARDRAELRTLVEGGLRPRIGATFPLERAAEALRFVADRRAVGKTVIVR